MLESPDIRAGRRTPAQYEAAFADAAPRFTRTRRARPTPVRQCRCSAPHSGFRDQHPHYPLAWNWLTSARIS